jgi:hypothetical protein
MAIHDPAIPAPLFRIEHVAADVLGVLDAEV